MSEIDVYEILVREHESMLLAYVYGLVHDHALAEDICQEAFIQGYKKLPTLEKRDSFPSWLRAIARHAAFAALRKRSREIAVQAEMKAGMQAEMLAGMEEVFAALDRDPSGVTGWGERVGALRECFELLPAQLQACCQLHYFDGRATGDIAGLLDSSLAAVLKRLQRARESLADCIGRRLKLEDA